MRRMRQTRAQREEELRALTQNHKDPSDCPICGKRIKDCIAWSSHRCADATYRGIDAANSRAWDDDWEDELKMAKHLRVRAGLKLIHEEAS